MKIWIGGSSGLSETYFNTFPIASTASNGIDDQNESWILIGCESTPPKWIVERLRVQQVVRYHYVCCDVCKLDDSNYISSGSEIQRVMDAIEDTLVMMTTTVTTTTTPKEGIESILVGIRPPLVTYRTNHEAMKYNSSMVNGLHTLLQRLIHQYASTLRFVLHISSIAAIDHVATQHLRSITATTTTTTTASTTAATKVKDVEDPSYMTLQFPYDRFKRQCEEMIEQVVQDVNHSQPVKLRIQYTSLRLGAIFSDTHYCIQCSALFLQMLFLGPYLPTLIDCNSSYNVSQLIHEILLSVLVPSASESSSSSNHGDGGHQSSLTALRPVYYYTRCVSQYPYPVPYGEFLISYKKAAYAWFVPILLPHITIEYGVVRLLHILTLLLQMLCKNNTIVSMLLRMPPCLESVDYLLQVTLNEHTFDMKETIQDFPNILLREETMEQCFRRRRRHRQNYKMHGII